MPERGPELVGTGLRQKAEWRSNRDITSRHITSPLLVRLRDTSPHPVPYLQMGPSPTQFISQRHHEAQGKDRGQLNMMVNARVVANAASSNGGSAAEGSQSPWGRCQAKSPLQASWVFPVWERHHLRGLLWDLIGHC